MGSELISKNVVVTAEQFNPSILKQLWLVRNNIVSEDDFGPGCLFADTVAQISSLDFDLLVVPQRAQFAPKVAPDRQQSVICERLGNLVSKLPETPYRAVGFNLTWHVTTEGESSEDLCRRLFFIPASPVHKFFDVPDARFGSYLSKDTLGFRLKLNALPTRLDASEKPPEHFIAFNFNYHHDLVEDVDRARQVCDMLSKWNDAVNESTSIVRSIGN